MTDFTEQEIQAIYRVVALRRDMRHFLPDPLDEALVERLLAAAHLAPSVGFMQPWRFINIRNAGMRQQIHSVVDTERRQTAKALGEREDEFMRLKVEGIRECAEVLVVALTHDRERQVFGRRSMPEMDLASVACAIQFLWLVARAEGVGMGWVSMFDPEQLAHLLGLPTGSRPIAVLCLGRVPEFYKQPMLEETRWAHRLDLATLVQTI